MLDEPVVEPGSLRLGTGTCGNVESLPMPVYLTHTLEQAIINLDAGKVRELLLIDNCPISDWSVRLAAVYHFRPRVFEILARCLADRRRLLLRRARQHLTEAQLSIIGITPEYTIVDSQAERIERFLRTAVNNVGIGLPVHVYSFSGSGRSVYHLIECNTRAAEILYRAGFTDVNEKDSWGYSPLFQLFPNRMARSNSLFRGNAFSNALSEFLDMCEWLQWKGRSLDRAYPETPLPPLHHVACTLGVCVSKRIAGARINRRDEYIKTEIRGAVSDWFSVFDRHEGLVLRMLMDTASTDSCYCACSSSGCLPSSILIELLIYGLRTPETLSYVGATFFDTRNLAADVERELHDSLAPTVLRLFTFECLGLAHSCQFHTPWLYALSRADFNTRGEPQTEEKVELLEKLVDEFLDVYLQMDVPLSTFFIAYWETRMKEVLEDIGAGRQLV